MSALNKKTKTPATIPQVLENQRIAGYIDLKGPQTVTLTRQYRNGVFEGKVTIGEYSQLYIHRPKNRKTWVVPSVSFDYTQKDLADRHTDPYLDLLTGKEVAPRSSTRAAC